MKPFHLVLTIVAIALAALMLAPDAYAQATRTWVSGVGDDVNPCSRTAPCKTFAGAISKTAAGGEISVLDPGGFGAVTITKSITINGTGTLAGILASLTNGVIVNAGAADKVILRNISINGAGNGLNGVRFLAGAQLTVENVTIEGFTGHCIDVARTGASDVIILDTTLTKCNDGVRLSTTAGVLTATLDRVRATNVNSNGVETAGGGQVNVSIKDSTLSHNSNDGVRLSNGTAVVNIENSVMAFNVGTGVDAVGVGSRIRISNTTIVNNGGGVGFVAGAFVETAGNNRVDGNTSSQVPNDTFTVQ